MDFRSEQDITKSNGFSLPLSRVLRHHPIVVLRFAYAAPSLIGCHGGILVDRKDRDRFGERGACGIAKASIPQCFCKPSNYRPCDGVRYGYHQRHAPTPFKAYTCAKPPSTNSSVPVM